MRLSKRATIRCAFLSLLTIELIVCVRYRGRTVVSERETAELATDRVPVLSGDAVLKIHQQLFEGTSHPIGSPENDAVRLRLGNLLVGVLVRLGMAIRPPALDSRQLEAPAADSDKGDR